MGDPTGPRDMGDGDDSDARAGDVPRDPWGEDKTDQDKGATGAHGVPAGDRGPAEGPGSSSDGRAHEWAMDDTEWVSALEDERPERRQMVPAFLVGALAGMVALGLVWATIAIFDDSDSGSVDTASAGSRTPTTGADPGEQTQASPQPSRMDRCRQADAELSGPLRAAGPAMAQWEVHVGAMNKLVVGAITLQQATAFWDQTRVGARENLDRFYSASQEVSSAGADCPSPGALTQAPERLSSCAQRIARERQAFEAARVAMGTWRTHVRHMEMLRMGHMTPAAATRTWLASWERGVQELQAYRIAEGAIDGSGSC
jgi:hypothetical protein